LEDTHGSIGRVVPDSLFVGGSIGQSRIANVQGVQKLRQNVSQLVIMLLDELRRLCPDGVEERAEEVADTGPGTTFVEAAAQDPISGSFRGKGAQPIEHVDRRPRSRPQNANGARLFQQRGG
jgi:hypothetical protein